MFKIDQKYGCCWPDVLKPIGEGTLGKEAFAQWWARNRRNLPGLPADLCEQWIFRHWTNSPFTFLPLDSLIVEREQWEGDDLLKSIYRAFGGELSPQFDYETFQRQGSDDRHQTAKALDTEHGITQWFYSQHLQESWIQTIRIRTFDMSSLKAIKGIAI